MPIGIRMALAGELGVLQELGCDAEIPIGLDVLAERNVRQTIESIVRETDESVDPFFHVRGKVAISVEEGGELGLQRVFVSHPELGRPFGDRIDLGLCLWPLLRYPECSGHEVVTLPDQSRELSVGVVLRRG